MSFEKFLVIYRFFYGNDYFPYYPGRNGCNHSRVQSLYYVLSRVKLDIGICGQPHCYTWSEHYLPHSNRLEGDLGIVDVKKDEIKIFYLYEYDDERFEFYLGQIVAAKMKTLKGILFDEEVKQLLSEAGYSEEYWIKLLAWVSFVKKDMSSASFWAIDRELRRRKKLWVSSKLNEKAVNVLQAITENIKD